MVRVLNNMDKDLVLNYLDKNNIETSFIIGNVLTFGLENDKTKGMCGDYYGYFEGGELKGILPFYNIGNCTPHYESVKAINEFSEIMASKDFYTLMGMEYIIEPFYIILNEVKALRFYSETSYYTNNAFKPYYLDGVEFISGDKLPSEIASRFILKAFEDNFDSIRNRKELSQAYTKRSIEKDYLFLVKNGEIKAQASIQTYTNRINQVGGVFTLNSERGKGYCKAVVSELCRRIISSGRTPTLMVGKNNTPAIRAYKALGFTHYDDYLIINFETA
jgi:RimJ/RimL family protein N-acetyltransferase